jgi:oligopeptide transport system ATP-binding protein
MSELLLEVEGVSKTYRSKRRRTRTAEAPSEGGVHRALVDVSLGLRRGDVVGIVGESGSGKSTLARCITLLERPDSGRVVLDGVDLTALSPKALRSARRRIQIVFQDPYASLNPRLTVGSALTEVLRVHKLETGRGTKARLAELLEMVGLPAGAAARYPADFSGGQRQRICIARALAASPDVLIADEAVSALDVSIQAQVLNLLMELLEELRFTMLFISHDLHVVARIAPTIAVMFAGRVVEVLPSGVPLEAAAHPYTQTLLAALPSLHAGRRRVSEGADATLATAATGCPFSARCPVAFERCVENPALLPVAEGHLVACHKSGTT